MTNKPPPFKGRNIRILIETPIKGGGLLRPEILRGRRSASGVRIGASGLVGNKAYAICFTGSVSPKGPST